MKIIQQARGAGKTHQMILWLERMKEEQPHSHPIIITHDAREAQRLIRDHNLRPDEVMSWHEYMRKMPNRSDVLGIDNVDMLLENIAHRPIEIVTSTLEEKT